MKLRYYPLEYLSYSSLSLFENCPYSFYLKYYVGIKPPKKDKATLGSQFQEVLNAKYLGEDTKVKLAEIDEKDRPMAEQMLAGAHDFKDIISVDSEYMVDLGFDIPFKFIPDLVTKDSIVENKYTTGYYNARMIHLQRQATLYYLGIRKVMGNNPKIFYQLFNPKKKRVELVETKRTDYDINDLMDWIYMTLNRIERCYDTNSWEGGSHKFCDFPNSCPLAR